MHCSLYIDDRLNCCNYSLCNLTGQWSIHPSARSDELRLAAAKAVILIMAFLIELG